MTAIDISIVIVNYNTVDLLRNCLDSLMRTEGRLCEIIVVDNGSMDGSAEMVEREFPTAILIRNAQNVGFSKANNQALRIASRRFLLLLNSDTVVRGCALGTMAIFLARHADVGAVTCKLLNEDGSTQASVSNRPGPILLLFRLLGVSRIISGDRARRRIARYCGFVLGKTVRSYLAPYVPTESPMEVENISGACLMLRREAIDNIGLLDEHFFMYFEDMDYCLRLRGAGWKLFYIPNAEIVHLVGRSSGGRMRLYSIPAYRALFYFYKKHFAYPTVLIVRLMVLGASSVRWLWNWLGSKISNDSVYRQNQADLKQVLRICIE